MKQIIDVLIVPTQIIILIISIFYIAKILKKYRKEITKTIRQDDKKFVIFIIILGILEILIFPKGILVFFDELEYLWQAKKISQLDLITITDYLGSSPAIGVFYSLGLFFGQNPVNAIYINNIFFLILITLIYIYYKTLTNDKKIQYFALIIFLLFPSLHLFTNIAKNNIISIVFLMTSILFIKLYEQKKSKDLLTASLIMALLATLVRYENILILITIFIFYSLRKNTGLSKNEVIHLFALFFLLIPTIMDFVRKLEMILFYEKKFFLFEKSIENYHIYLESYSLSFLMLLFSILFLIFVMILNRSFIVECLFSIIHLSPVFFISRIPSIDRFFIIPHVFISFFLSSKLFEILKAKGSKLKKLKFFISLSFTFFLIVFILITEIIELGTIYGKLKIGERNLNELNSARIFLNKKLEKEQCLLIVDHPLILEPYTCKNCIYYQDILRSNEEEILEMLELYNKGGCILYIRDKLHNYEKIIEKHITNYNIEKIYNNSLLEIYSLT